MGKIKFRIHPLFVVFAVLLVYFGQGVLFVNYLVVMIFHEYSHAYMAKKLGYNLQNIKLIPFGICLNLNSNSLSPTDEIKIAIAGPLCNFILCAFVIAVWWVFPATYNVTNLFCYANFVTATFNLLPAFPLDGGRVLHGVSVMCVGQNKASKICKISSVILCVALFMLFVASFFVAQANFTYLFVIFCLLTGFSQKDEKLSYSFLNVSKAKKDKKVLKVKTLYVKGDTKLFRLCKYIDANTFLNLYVCDDNGEFLDMINEQELTKLLESCNSTTSIVDALALSNINKGTF
ncbi:MAG: M50 family metallopeptidase [Christensenellales bacterium]